MSESVAENGISTPAAETPEQPAPRPAFHRFDATRPDRLPRPHLRSIQMLYENFARSATSSLSAYLRSYVSLNLGGILQISYGEFLERLPACTSIACFGIQPYTGNAILEVNPSLTFPILEILLGGTPKPTQPIQRKLTEIEQSLLENLFRILAHDLSEAWKHLAHLDFALVSVGTEAQFLQAMNLAETVLAVKVEAHLGESAGAINIVLPSTAVKAILRERDRERLSSKTEVPPEHEAQMFQLIQSSRVKLEARLPRQQIQVGELMLLEPGDVLAFDV